MLSNYIKFPLVMGILGFVFSSRTWIRFMDKNSPQVGLIIYYFIIFLAILFLQHIGLVVAEMPFDSVQHALGTLLIVFSFFIIFDWESYYITLVTSDGTTPPPSISNVYLQSEDGAVFDFWYNTVKLTPDQSRTMTYIVTPIILSALGIILIRGKRIRMSPI
jgi:hypothetical protein